MTQLPQKNHLKVLTYNIHKGFNLSNRRFVLEQIRQGVHQVNADVVCLQEVCGFIAPVPGTELHQKWETQFEYVADQTWPHYTYGKNAVYEGGDHGNAILSLFPIVKNQNLNISTNKYESRGLLHAVIEIPQGGERINLLTTHMNLLESSRNIQLDLISNYIKKNIGPSDKTIFAGDFNDWRCILNQEFYTRLQFKEAFLETSDRNPKTFPSIMPILPLDRVYYSGFKVEHTQVLNGYNWNKLSDHLPLLTEFSW
ncbi:EEP domain-containing protein [bacterium]|nr:EEP domain-containing protein [bacterium]